MRMFSLWFDLGKAVFIFQLISLLRAFNSSANAGEVNLALHKPTSQSSEVNQFTSSLVVDGRTDADSWCAETREEATPWWTVDLQSIYKIQNVRIYFRRSSDYTWSLSVYTHKDPMGVRVICQQDIDRLVEGILLVNCQGHAGQFITVQLDDTPGVLKLCEVEVFGEKPLRYNVFSRHFCRYPEKTSHLIASMPARSRIECAVLCSRVDNCDAFHLQTDYTEKFSCQLKEFTTGLVEYHKVENYNGC